MKKSLLLLLLALPMAMSAQKIKEDRIDKMEGHRVITTTQEILFNATFKNPKRLWFNVMAVEKDGIALVSLHFATDIETSVYEGDRIIFLFENGDKVELKAEQSFILDHFYAKIAGVSQRLFGVSPYYSMTKDAPELKKLTENVVTDIRIEFRDSYWDYPINGKAYAKFKKSIDLVLDKLNK